MRLNETYWNWFLSILRHSSSQKLLFSLKFKYISNHIISFFYLKFFKIQDEDEDEETEEVETETELEEVEVWIKKKDLNVNGW